MTRASEAAVWAMVLGWVGAASAGCGPPGPPRYPGELLSPVALGSDFLAEQQLAFEARGRHSRLSVVLQKRADELLLLGLTPFGTRAFAITLRGTQLDMRFYVDQRPPVEPRWVMLDIERALRPPFTAARREGRAVVRVAGERVTERWSGGRLVERTYERIDGDPSGKIRIGYDPGWRKDGPAAHIRYDNGWLGYRLTITTTTLRVFQLGDGP